MARIFTDTCALVKIYRTEVNSSQVRACFIPDDIIILAQITVLEFPSAFYGMVRQQLITPNEAASYINAFRADLSKYDVLASDPEIVIEAERILDDYAVSQNIRPLDSLQLAAALVEHRRNQLDSFVTTDKVLITVARMEGLTVKP